MTLRKIGKVVGPKGHCIVKYDVDWQGYRCQFYNESGDWIENADYFTDDRDDAFETAEQMVGNKDKQD